MKLSFTGSLALGVSSTRSMISALSDNFLLLPTLDVWATALDSYALGELHRHGISGYILTFSPASAYSLSPLEQRFSIQSSMRASSGEHFPRKGTRAQMPGPRSLIGTIPPVLCREPKITSSWWLIAEVSSLYSSMLLLHQENWNSAFSAWTSEKSGKKREKARQALTVKQGLFSKSIKSEFYVECFSCLAEQPKAWKSSSKQPGDIRYGKGEYYLGCYRYMIALI